MTVGTSLPSTNIRTDDAGTRISAAPGGVNVMATCRHCSGARCAPSLRRRIEAGEDGGDDEGDVQDLVCLIGGAVMGGAGGRWD
jgi:hypothetical protein